MARAAVSTAAAAACLTLATPAWASSTVPLHSDHEGKTAANFSEQKCDDPKFDNLPAGHDGWHFVLPTNGAGDFESLTLTFSAGIAGTVTVNVPDPTDPYTDFLSSTGGRNPQVKHAYVFTPAGWTLVDGTATISGEADRFNLSHTCPGTPVTQSPTPTPTQTPTPTPTESDSESPNPSVTPSNSGGAGGGDSDDEGGLPVTGAAATTIALLGVGLIGGGATLLVLRRRRDNITFTS
ncbi:LPXTG cell wall anchor domain-containing protein [Micromonospora deserti]|uniref:LPXTG cell wall anchor domain-containing protein n=1 Tax=Micromonospora deserti TaxID=2070366 RepID=UPI001F1D6FAE|nr:LPXTG cell wall anchor domain-containing protein [Micromonospora deserti]